MSAQLGHEVKPLIVTRIEGGKRPLSVDELVAIGATLGVDAAVLLEEVGAPAPDMKVQAAQLAYLAARDALVTADGVRRAAIERWLSARAELQAAFQESGATSSDWLIGGAFDFLVQILGDPDDIRYPDEYPNDGEDDGSDT